MFSVSTGLSFKTYLPSEGVSSSPRIASSVDFPQPEGPEMDTYSPRWISRWIPASACVSTSSVVNTLVTLSKRSNGSINCLQYCLTTNSLTKMFQKSEQADSPEQDLLEKLQGPRILGLPEPENRLFSDRRIAIGPRHLDQQRHAFVTRKLAESEDGLFLDIGIGIVLDSLGDG